MAAVSGAFLELPTDVRHQLTSGFGSPCAEPHEHRVGHEKGRLLPSASL